MPLPATVLYNIKDIRAESRYEKANDVYLEFNIKGQPGVKAKTKVQPHENEAYAWQNEVLDLNVSEPANAILEVQAYSKRTLVPDHSIGEFTQPLPPAGSTETYTGTLISKKDEKNGVVKFTIFSESPAGVDTTGLHPSGQPLNAQGKTVPYAAGSTPGATGAAPTVGAAGASAPASGATGGSGAPVLGASGTAASTAPTSGITQTSKSPGDTGTGSTNDQARARTNTVAQEAGAKSNATANAASGKTLNTVDGAQQKLQGLKGSLSQKAHPPTTSPTADASAGVQGQSSFNKAIGIPSEAKTASDAPGNATATNAPYDAASGGSVGSLTGPTAPTGQGGILAQTGATAGAVPAGGGVGQTVANAAYTAADKAQKSLQAAKQQFSGSAPQAKT